MIRASFAKAFGHLRAPQFRQTALIGAALSAVLLLAVYALLIQLFTLSGGETFTFSDGTRMDRLGSFFSTTSIVTMVMLSVFLMVPVASLFTGLHLNAVADTVEGQHFSRLSTAKPRASYQLWRDSVTYFTLLVFLNFAGLVGLVLLGPFLGLVLLWVLNGWLLAREYSAMILARREGPDHITAFQRRHGGALLLAGMAFVLLLAVPLLNLLMPVVGVAAFTHLCHALSARQTEGAVK